MATDAERDGATGAVSREPGEAEAWAEVQGAWADEERHGAYLARFGDLEGLAVAGRRYRAVLEARPGDPTALRFRDEILRRATALALVPPPRVEPSRTRAARIVRAAGIALALAFAAVAAAGAIRLLSALGGRP